MIKNCKYLIKYNNLKLKNRLRERELEKHINELIQQLAEERANVEYAKMKERLAKKQLSQTKQILKDLKDGTPKK